MTERNLERTRAQQRAVRRLRASDRARRRDGRGDRAGGAAPRLGRDHPGRVRDAQAEGPRVDGGIGGERVIGVLAWSFGESLLVALVLAVYAAVIWMIVEILQRPDSSGVAKVLWTISAIVFSVATLIVYFLLGEES